MIRLAPALVCAGLFPLAACFADGTSAIFGDRAQRTPYSSFSNFTQEPLQLLGAHLAGDIGPMRSLDEPAQLNGFHERDFTSVEVIVSNPRGSAMSLLDIHGGINHPSLVPGATFAFSRNDTPEEGAFFISGLGCAGTGAVGDWDYDRPLESVEVTVEATDNPEISRLHFTSATRDDVSHAYVDVMSGTGR